MKVPLTKPLFDRREEGAAIKVLRSGWHTTGPATAEFENQFRDYCDVKYAVAVSNCTTALFLSLIIGGIKPGDEVIVPSYTFIATANVVVHTGAKPVFVDVEENTSNIDVKDIARKITKKTRAIIPVDQVGLACDIDSIRKIAKAHKLFVVVDSACAIGSRYKGKPVGGFGDITCFSLHPRKLISTGEGGLITTNNREFAEQAKMWRSHGASISDIARHKTKQIILERYLVPGYNFRITDIQSALGIEQLKKLPNILKRRKILADRYTRLLAENKYIKTPYVPKYAEHNWQSYIIRLTPDSKISRDSLMKKLLDDGIATRRGVMASHLEPYYVKVYGRAKLPVTEILAKNTICLPIFPQMTFAEQDFIIARINKYLS